MCDSKWPEAIAVLSVAVSTMVVLTPWERVGPIDWDAVSGVGAFVVAIAAIGVPIWQRAAARKDSAGAAEAAGLAALELEWVVSNRVNSYANRLDSLVGAWKGKHGIPADSTFESIRQQLLKASSRTTDDFGGALIDLLLESVDALQEAAEFARKEEAELRRGGAGSALATSSAVTSVFYPTSSHASAADVIPARVTMAKQWMENVSSAFARRGIRPPKWGVNE